MLKKTKKRERTVYEKISTKWRFRAFRGARIVRRKSVTRERKVFSFILAYARRSSLFVYTHERSLLRARSFVTPFFSMTERLRSMRMCASVSVHVCRLGGRKSRWFDHKCAARLSHWLFELCFEIKINRACFFFSRLFDWLFENGRTKCTSQKIVIFMFFPIETLICEKITSEDFLDQLVCSLARLSRASLSCYENANVWRSLRIVLWLLMNQDRYWIIVLSQVFPVRFNRVYSHCLHIFIHFLNIISRIYVKAHNIEISFEIHRNKRR